MLSCIPVWDDACELGRCVMFCTYMLMFYTLKVLYMLKTFCTYLSQKYNIITLHAYNKNEVSLYFIDFIACNCGKLWVAL